MIFGASLKVNKIGIERYKGTDYEVNEHRRLYQSLGIRIGEHYKLAVSESEVYERPDYIEKRVDIIAFTPEELKQFFLKLESICDEYTILNIKSLFFEATSGKN